MIVEFAKIVPEEVRAMFLALYDESEDVYKRIASFKENAKKLHLQYRKDAVSHFQDENTISIYLWLRYPDKYYIYKFGESKRIAEKLEFNYIFKKGAYTINVQNCYRLYKEINKEIKKDLELKELLENHITETCYSDPELITLTLNIGFFISRYYGEQSESNSKKGENIPEKHIVNPDNVTNMDIGDLHYWWLNANPKIWSFSNIDVGEVQDYTLYNANGNKRRVFQNFLDAKVGDIVMESLIYAIFEQLPNANSFRIDCKCEGVLREYFNEENDDGSRMNMIKKDAVWTGAGMLDTLAQYKRRNSFEYKLAIFYPDSGEFKYEKIINGKEIDVLSNGSEDIINKTFDEDWWSYNLNLWTDFDFEKYPDTIEKLHNIVRNTIPESEVSYCESTWEYGDMNVLCSGIQWNCSSLSEIQDFLDQLNKVLLPIKDEVNAGGEGTWEVKNEFAVATWEWTDQGFKVKGCLY